MTPLDDFHFLRPYWLLALLPLAGLLWLLWRRRTAASAWARVCDPHLLPHLLVDLGGRVRRTPLLLLALGWLLATLALAGPTWSEVPQPVFRSQAARVLVLDLSRSMDAGDVAPSRLARARFKVLDLLRRSGEGQSALIAYAGEPFVVAPLTDDADTIAALVPSLTTDLMPLQGSRPDRALRTAAELLRQAGAPHGEVILISDGSDAPAATLEAAGALRAAGIRLSLLAVGTTTGAPIPTGQGYLQDGSGAIVMPRTDLAALRRIAEAGGGTLVPLRADDGDLDALLRQAPAGALDANAEASGIRTDRWREQGPWLVLALLPLAALAFRRGWLAALALAFVLPQPGTAYAFGWSDLWSRADQQGARALAAGDAQAAAGLFRDPAWRGTAAYRSGDYAAAAETFAALDSADAHYNHGNALARQGELEQALAAYDTALAQDPDLADARHNRDLVQRLLQQRDASAAPPQRDDGRPQEGSAGQSEPQSAAQEGDAADREAPATEPAGPTNAAGSDAAAEDGNAAEDGDAAGRTAEAAAAAQPSPQQDEAAAAVEKQPPAASAPPGSGTEPPAPPAAQADADGREAAQASEQWLRRIPDDPGGLLRRKFLLQHRQGEYRAEEETQSW